MSGWHHLALLILGVVPGSLGSLRAEEPPHFIKLTDPSGRTALCERIQETAEVLHVERVPTGKRFRVPPSAVAAIERHVPESEAIEQIGLLPYTAWRVYRSAGRRDLGTLLLLPAIQRSGNSSDRCGRIDEQLREELQEHGRSTLVSLVVPTAGAVPPESLLMERAVAQLARHYRANHLLSTFISERENRRSFAIQLKETSGRTLWRITHEIQTDVSRPSRETRLEPQLTFEAAANAITFSHDDALLYSAGPDGTVRGWDIGKREPQHVWYGHEASIQDIALSPAGDRLASVCAAGRVVIRRIPQGTQIRSLQGHDDVIRAVVFSPNGQWLATGGDDKTVKLWNTQTFQLSAELSGHTGFIRSLIFTNDGKRLISSANDHTIRVWQLEEPGSSVTLAGHSGYVYDVAIGDRGRLLASAGGDGTACLWRLANGQQVGSLTPTAGGVLCLDFARQGQLMATAHANETILLWNALTEELKAAVGGITGSAHQITVSTQLLGAACGDGTVRIWSIEELLNAGR